MAAPDICVPSTIMLWIIACHNEKKSCGIRNPKAIRVDMHLMRMPAVAASPDHPHHTSANCASLASAFTTTFSNGPGSAGTARPYRPNAVIELVQTFPSSVLQASSSTCLAVFGDRTLRCPRILYRAQPPIILQPLSSLPAQASRKSLLAKLHSWANARAEEVGLLVKISMGRLSSPKTVKRGHLSPAKVAAVEWEGEVMQVILLSFTAF